MSARHATLLAALAAIWGGSYLLIKYALDGFSAAAIVSARSLLASVVLFVALRATGAASGALADLRARPWQALLLGATAVAIPFLLITFGEHVVPSGLTAVLISPASLFIALLAPLIDPSERIDRRQAVGMAMGLGGTALVVGVESVHTLGQFLGALAMIGAAFFYGLSSFVVKGRYGHLAAMQTSWISVTVAGVLTLPVAIATTPGHTPTAGAIASVLALGVVGTALAFVIFYKLINEIGAGRAALVSYLAPGVALFYGAVFRHEAVTIAALAGLALILAGVALASRKRRVALPVAPPAPEPAGAC
jgi:drug/metabolite transporter (DMT)-like permease